MSGSLHTPHLHLARPHHAQLFLRRHHPTRLIACSRTHTEPSLYDTYSWRYELPLYAIIPDMPTEPTPLHGVNTVADAHSRTCRPATSCAQPRRLPRPPSGASPVPHYFCDRRRTGGGRSVTGAAPHPTQRRDAYPIPPRTSAASAGVGVPDSRLLRES